ncbi:hypothetical protein HMPREF3033_01726 [Veillonellaceae bacterium DNF00751]|nr:hypothetical protein HMPREF3033_01726 [Veillonellaceae bacterium DNF00751]
MPSFPSPNILFFLIKFGIIKTLPQTEVFPSDPDSLYLIV